LVAFGPFQLDKSAFFHLSVFAKSIEYFISPILESLNIKLPKIRMEIESALESLGLSPTEIKLYLILLKVGSSKAGSIITRSKLQSSTVYHTLGSLSEKGMLSHVMIGKSRFFQASDPDGLLSLIDEKRNIIQSAIPKLKEIENTKTERQSSRAFEGVNGLRVALGDILATLKPGDDYCVFQMPKEGFFNGQVVSILRAFQLKRAAMGIKLRTLAMKENRSIAKKIFKNVRLTEIRYLDEFTPNSIIIYANKILMLDWNNMDKISAFAIESRTFADTYRVYFEQKWKVSSR
jgi:sugar-specific transcriptional regulator TrmB